MTWQIVLWCERMKFQIYLVNMSVASDRRGLPSTYKNGPSVYEWRSKLLPRNQKNNQQTQQRNERTEDRSEQWNKYLPELDSVKNAHRQTRMNDQRTKNNSQATGQKRTKTQNQRQDRDIRGYYGGTNRAKPGRNQGNHRSTEHQESTTYIEDWKKYSTTY